MRKEAEHLTPKATDYYTGYNGHVLEMLPAGARRFLDVGCAGGELGRRIKEAVPGAIVHGIEREPVAIALAERVLDRVFVVDLEAGLAAINEAAGGGNYDCIICGDVLEHLIDPWSVLRGLVGLLAPGGHVLASIPNIRYYKVLRDLVWHGRFRYRESGVLDSTHLRFFTLEEMKRLFAGAGLEVVGRRPRYGGNNTLVRWADSLLFGRLEELRAIQYTLVGRHAPPPASASPRAHDVAR